MDSRATAVEGTFCEGNTHPLESNRTTELALECWNLRKTIMEQSSHMIKLKKEVRSNKNLVKNLQRCVADVEHESLMKTKDITAKKMKILQLDKKITDLTTTNSVINSSFTRNKKILVTLQDKIAELQRENKGLHEKINSTTVSLREEMSDQESTLCLEIRKVSEDRDRCAKELAVQTSFLDEANIRIAELEGITKELTDNNDAQTKQFNEDLATLTKEQEEAYDLLHAKLEHIWRQRDELCRRLVDKEHETHQLMSFILMEGLQLPELTQPTSSAYSKALEQLTDSPPQAGEEDGDAVYGGGDGISGGRAGGYNYSEGGEDDNDDQQQHRGYEYGDSERYYEY